MEFKGVLKLDGDIRSEINNSVQIEISKLVKGSNIKSRVINEITNRVKIQVDRMYREGKFTEIIKKLGLNQVTESLDITDKSLSELTDMDLDKIKSEILIRVIDKISTQVASELLSDSEFKESIKSQILKNIIK